MTNRQPAGALGGGNGGMQSTSNAIAPLILVAAGYTILFYAGYKVGGGKTGLVGD